MGENQKMKILCLCTKFPHPPKDGGTMAMLSMIRGFYRAGHEVTVLTMNTPKHYVTLSSIPVEVRIMAEFHAVDVNTQVNVFDAMANLFFSRESYHVLRFTSRPFRDELERLLNLKQYDVIQLETLYMAPYISTIRKMNSKALISLRAHNIENEIWRRRAQNSTNPIKEYYFYVTANRIRNYEEMVFSANQFDVVIPITGRDSRIIKELGVKKPVFVSEAGIDADALDKREVKMEHPSLFYIGSLDWEPNREGIDWFLKEVWPTISRTYPKVKFYLAGRNMPESYHKLANDQLVVLGEVENAAQLIKSKSIMIVPILSGSGMRVKIVEGMAYGKAIVATTMAAEGMGVRHNQHILLADKPDRFINAISVLIEKRSMLDTIGFQARKFCEDRFDNDKIVGRLLKFYQDQLGKGKKSG